MPSTAAERIAASMPHDAPSRSHGRIDPPHFASVYVGVCFLYQATVEQVDSTSEGCIMPETSTRRARRWADLVAIIASVAAIGNALWGPLIFSTRSAAVTTDPGAGYNWFAFGVGGILGVLGLIVAQKRPIPGRIALAVG